MTLKKQQKYINLKPFSPLGYCNIGELLIYLGKWEDAINLVLPALDKVNLDKDICNLASKLYDYQGLYQLAIEYRKKALSFEL